MIGMLIFIVGYTMMGLFAFGYQCGKRKDKGRYIGEHSGADFGWHPNVIDWSIFWPLMLGYIVFGSPIARLGKWIGERALNANERQLAAREKRRVEIETRAQEVERFEKELDEELKEERQAET